MPKHKDMSKQKKLTYEEAANLIADHETMTIHYDGISRTGHWYEDHMLNMFSQCRMIRIGSREFKVVEWPENMTQKAGV